MPRELRSGATAAASPRISLQFVREVSSFEDSYKSVPASQMFLARSQGTATGTFGDGERPIIDLSKEVCSLSFRVKTITTEMLQGSDLPRKRSSEPRAASFRVRVSDEEIGCFALFRVISPSRPYLGVACRLSIRFSAHHILSIGTKVVIKPLSLPHR